MNISREEAENLVKGLNAQIVTIGKLSEVNLPELEYFIFLLKIALRSNVDNVADVIWHIQIIETHLSEVSNSKKKLDLPRIMVQLKLVSFHASLGLGISATSN